MNKIYFDFDGTLFNTDLFYNDFINICLNYNIKMDDINLIKNKLFSNKLFNLDELTNYLKNKYNISNNFIIDINKLYSDKYVFDDVINCLEKLSNKYELNLLTYGDFNYQMKKINGSNLKKYFKDVIITDKDKSKISNIIYNNSIFIDNNPKEIKGFINSNSFKVIRIRRVSDKYSNINLDLLVNEYKFFNNDFINELMK